MIKFLLVILLKIVIANRCLDVWDLMYERNLGIARENFLIRLWICNLEKIITRENVVII